MRERERESVALSFESVRSAPLRPAAGRERGELGTKTIRRTVPTVSLQSLIDCHEPNERRRPATRGKAAVPADREVYAINVCMCMYVWMYVAM